MGRAGHLRTGDGEESSTQPGYCLSVNHIVPILANRLSARRDICSSGATEVLVTRRWERLVPMEPTWLARCAGFPQANIQLSCMAIFTSKGVPVKLDTVTVSNFRSIESVTLAECGSFNVLIGKNNAGKSNILLAIHTFFSCFRSGEPVFLDPPTGATLDHHKSEPNSIKITIGFQLSPAERDELVREMSAYAPQVKNTVELMPCELGLEATATIPMSSGPTFAYISKVAFYDYPRHAREHAVISVDSAAADELAGRARRLRQLEVDRMYLQNILRVVEDNADLARCKNDTSRALSMMSFRAGATPLVATPETQRMAEDSIRNATEYSIFSGNINGLASSKSVDALEVKKQPLENRIESLSGRESVMPEYALASTPTNRSDQSDLPNRTA